MKQGTEIPSEISVNASSIERSMHCLLLLSTPKWEPSTALQGRHMPGSPSQTALIPPLGTPCTQCCASVPV